MNECVVLSTHHKYLFIMSRISQLNNPSYLDCFLFCFHHVGGNGKQFRQWGRDLEENGIKLFGVCLPGRRMTETMPTSIAECVDNIIDEVRMVMNESCIDDNKQCRVVFFGHSMGGIVAFELARRLQEEKGTRIDQLIVSAVKSPFALTRNNSSKSQRHNHLKSDNDLFKHIEAIGGVPVGVDSEFVRRAIPLMKRDYKVFETYNENNQKHIDVKLHCPIVTMCGEHDPYVSQEDMVSWSNYSTVRCNQYVFNGSHFYINESDIRDTFIQEIIYLCSHDMENLSANVPEIYSPISSPKDTIRRKRVLSIHPGTLHK